MTAPVLRPQASPEQASATTAEEVPLPPARDGQAAASRPRWVLPALVALAGLWAWTRFIALDASLWGDEAHTVQQYAVQGPAAILDPDGYVPNNHILFSLLLWASRPLLGMSEPALRFWSVLPALAAAVLLTWWAWHRFGAGASVAVAALMVFDPLQLVLAPQARGYGLALLAAASMLVAAARVEQHPDRHGGIPLGVAGLVGVATLPIMAVPVAAHVAVLARRRSTRRAALTAAAISGGGAALLYHAHVGVLMRFSDAVATDYGRQLSGWGLVRGPFELLAVPVGERVLPAGPTAVGSFVAAVLLAAGLAWLARTPSHRRLLAHAVGPTVATVAVVGLLQSHVAPRYLSYLQPGLLVVMALGGLALLTTGQRFVAGRLSGRLRIAAAGLLGALVLAAAGDLAALAYWNATVPHEPYRQSVEVIDAADIDTVVTNNPHPVGLAHYREGTMPQVVDPADTSVLCEMSAPLAFVDDPLESAGGDLSCLEDRGAVEVQLRQRHGRGYMSVWLLADRPAS